MKNSNKIVLKKKLTTKLNNFCNAFYDGVAKYRDFYISICPLAKEIMKEYRKELQQQNFEK